MSSEGSAVVRLESAQAVVRDHFLGWQCRLRQLAVRQDEGRPSEGMRPVVALGEQPLARIVVLINKRPEVSATAEFRHMVRRTHDPKDRRDAALKFLASTYYQHPGEFSDRPTALFGPGSALAERLLAAGRCRLVFEQFRQRYDIPVAIERLSKGHPDHEATLWHNSLFNPAIPAEAAVLAFTPDWAAAEADPPAF